MSMTNVAIFSPIVNPQTKETSAPHQNLVYNYVGKKRVRRTRIYT